MAEQSVTLNPGESKVISFEAIPREAKTYQVSVDGLTGAFTAISGPTFYWLRPTGHIPGNWNDAELAYDGWTDTRAEVINVGTQSWSPWLELTIEPTEISAVRWWGSSPISPRKVQVDVRYNYDGAYHNIYEGAAVKIWDNGLTIPGGAQIISGARMRFYNPSRSMRMKFRVNEFQLFGYAEEPPTPPVPPPTTNLSGFVADKVTGTPIVGASGTVYQDKDTDTWKFKFTTDAQGYYLIESMLDNADQTKMVIYADGYVTYTNENLPISEGDNQLNVRMIPG